MAADTPMNSANINDPTAIKTLLDQLRASQAWRDTLNSNSSNVASEHHADAQSSPASLDNVQREPRAQSADEAPPPPSVAALLSQLRTSEWTSVAINTPPMSNARAVPHPSRNIPRPSQEQPPSQPEQCAPKLAAVSSKAVQGIRSMSFQQALPHLTELADDPGFLAAISRLRQEQNALERQLWEERQTIHKKHEEKVKVARTKATLIRAGLSKHEADMMNDAYRRDLQRFDTERVLLAWDALVQKQQTALETLGVPTMFAATFQAECEKQRRVVQVLEGL
ncbi:hypothetical protein JVU11DRAFT_1331 [Chiua virens]|nr:hypothetical protein JVU11DRAFT_1331 [Chiua virens]